MDFILDILREYPVVCLFLTVGIGFYLGRLKIGHFSLGSVTAVLIVGVIIGQLDIPLSSQLKSVFFMMFLFSIGYSVGPKFFRSLKGNGLKQVGFAILMSMTCFLVTVGVAILFAYNAGESVGLFSGAQTCSSLLGVGSDAITNFAKGGAISAGDVDNQLNIIPVCYAVTYIFGTLGTVIILGTLGPKLLGGLEKVKAQTAELEASMDDTAWLNDPVNVNALRHVSYRTFSVNNIYFATGPTVSQVEEHMNIDGRRVFIDRVRRVNGMIEEVTESTRIYIGDHVVMCGRREFLVADTPMIGEEIDDQELLQYPVQRIPVLIINRHLVGKPVSHLRSLAYMRGVVIGDITRAEATIEVGQDTILKKRDCVTLLGRRENIRRAADRIGFMDIPSKQTDIMFLGLAIFIGGFFGAIPLVIDNIPISFGTSGGSLIAGLVFGWLRSRRPTWGKIPDSALWLMNHLGLNVFIAVIGIDAAPSFFSGIQSVGVGLLFAGMIATTIPLLVGIWMGKKVFKFHPAITLGCCAGTRTCTAALGAVQESLGSTIPSIGYTVTYAVSNIMLVIWGLLVVFIMA